MSQWLGVLVTRLLAQVLCTHVMLWCDHSKATPTGDLGLTGQGETQSQETDRAGNLISSTGFHIQQNTHSPDAHTHKI